MNKPPVHRAGHRNLFFVPIVLMLFLILGQSAYWAGSFNALAHALDHEKTGPAAALERHHAHVSHDDGVPGPDAVGETEHRLLHQFEHNQLVPLSVSTQRVTLATAVMPAFPLLCMAQRRNERMFRPPRLS